MYGRLHTKDESKTFHIPSPIGIHFSSVWPFAPGQWYTTLPDSTHHFFICFLGFGNNVCFKNLQENSKQLVPHTPPLGFLRFPMISLWLPWFSMVFLWFSSVFPMILTKCSHAAGEISISLCFSHGKFLQSDRFLRQSSEHSDPQVHLQKPASRDLGFWKKCFINYHWCMIDYSKLHFESIANMYIHIYIYRERER